MRISDWSSDVCSSDLDVAHVGVQLQRRQRTRRARQLLARLIVVVRVQVRVAERVHEIADAQPCHLCHHVREQGVAGDVERHAEDDVAAALVELAARSAARRVGKEGVSTCRYGWSAYHYKK